MDSIAPPAPEATPVCARWVPAVDRRTGIPILILDASVRHLVLTGASTWSPEIDLSTAFGELGKHQPIAAPPAGGDPIRYSKPRSLCEWASAFGMSSDTMGRWFRTGQVRAVRRGRFWCVDVRDLPRAVKD